MLKPPPPNIIPQGRIPCPRVYQMPQGTVSEPPRGARCPAACPVQSSVEDPEEDVEDGIEDGDVAAVDPMAASIQEQRKEDVVDVEKGSDIFEPEEAGTTPASPNSMGHGHELAVG